MAEISREGTEVNARIVYWGAEGAGKTTNLEQIHARLRADHRGSLRRVPTRLDPTVSYEVLPIELGEVSGVRTRIQVVAVPGAPEHAPTRKQLLDRIDGVVFVIDAQRERIDDNLASFAELRRSLASYGRTIADVPLVLQYNKRDLADPYALEELHRRLDTSGAAAFEAIALDGTAVLPTLTTVSKRVVRALREQPATSPSAAPASAAVPPPGVSQILDHATAAQPPASIDDVTAPSELEAVAEPIDAPDAFAAELLPAEPARTDTPEPADTPEAAVSATRAALDPAFEQYRDEYEKEDGGLDLGSFEIVAIGAGQLLGARSLAVPLELRDAGGHTLRLRLRLSLDPDDGSDEG